MRFNLVTFSALAYGVTAISLSSALAGNQIEGLEEDFSTQDLAQTEGLDQYLAQSYQDEGLYDLLQTYSDVEASGDSHAESESESSSEGSSESESESES